MLHLSSLFISLASNTNVFQNTELSMCAYVYVCNDRRKITFVVLQRWCVMQKGSHGMLKCEIPTSSQKQDKADDGAI